MNTIGQLERTTQNRMVQLFQTQLGYDYIGNWESRLAGENVSRAS